MPTADKYVRFPVNTPVTVVLRTEGVMTQSKFTMGDQYHYRVADGRSMYVHPIVYRKLQGQGVVIGDTVTICKREQIPGKSDSIIWDAQIEKTPLSDAARKPQAAAELLDRVQSIDELPDTPERPLTRLEHALRTALEAAKGAEEFSDLIGHPVRFTKDDIRLMAQTLVINTPRDRAA